MSPLLSVPLFVILLCSSVSAQDDQGASHPADPIAAAAASGDWHRTQALASAALKTHPRDPAAWTYLGLAASHLGQPQEALRDFAQAARLAPNATYAHNNYGASLEASGKPQQALQEYRKSLALDPRQPPALVNLARLLTHDGTPDQLPEARRLLQTAWQLAPDPEIARSLLLLAPCASAKSALPSPPADLEPYAQAIQATPPPPTPEDRQRVGHALLNCALTPEALAFYTALLAANPSDPAAITGQAQAQLALAHPVDAGRTLETALAQGIQSPTVYALLARVYQQTGHMDHAVDALRRAVELDPADDELHFRYGMLLLDAHAPKAAEIRMKQAVDRNPASARLWFVLGLAQFDQTNPAAAQLSFDRSVALDPHFPPALAYRGLAALDQQHYPEAEQWYRRALALDPTAADLHLLLAEVLEKEHPQDTRDVREELFRTLSLDPALASPHLSLGRLDLDQGKPAEAAQHLETALRLDPTQRQAHFYLARAYRQLHQPDRAAAEGKLFSEQEAAAQLADRAALQNALRQFAHTAF